MSLKAAFVLIFLSISLGLFAQKKDSVKLSTIGSDSTKVVKVKTGHSPAKAALYSTILPGLGQAYNHKYWKIPIIYAGIGTFTYFIVTNWKQYDSFQNALQIRSHNGIDQYYYIYTTDNLVAARDYYHRYRDLSFIGAAVFYVLNIVDAEVDAQLFTFNVSDDLSLHVAPSLNTFATSTGLCAAPGLSFALKLK